MKFEGANWFLFIMGIAFFVMIMTNVIMNVAAIAISLPVALVIAPYLGVAPEVILFVSLATAGMPFLLLVGAAPNAIAYESGLFTAGEFFAYGTLASIMLMTSGPDRRPAFGSARDVLYSSRRRDGQLDARGGRAVDAVPDVGATGAV